MLKILIADDHAILRKGLVGLLQEEFITAEIEEVSNGIDVIEKVREKVFDLIILDISMPKKDGIETLKQIRAEGLNVPILVLSVHSEEQYAVRVLKAGGSGFVNKNSAITELAIAIHKVLAGKKYISAATAEMIIENIDNAGSTTPAIDNLSDRELQVLQLIASGKTVTEIAGIIFLSVNTVSTYRARILEKLCLNNSVELIRYAIDNGLA